MQILSVIDILQNHILSLLIIFPLIAALVLALLPNKNSHLFFVGGIIATVVEFIFSLHLIAHFKNTGSFEFIELLPWITSFNVHYFVGVDGVSIALIVLTTLLVPLALLASIHSIQTRAKEFIVCVLMLQSGMVGVFCALDLFLFYVFWEVMLVPMYLIVGIWGGPRRIYAAIKFFIFTMAGSLVMLVAVLVLYFKGGKSFNLMELSELSLPLEVQKGLFLAFALAFAIKVPLFPLHTWLPDAHVEAPTAGSVILAGVLLKMGTYGFFRFAMPLFPEAFVHYQPLLMTLATVGIVYGALVALVQTDIKKLIAYSSVSHLGVVMLGLFSLNKTGMLGGLSQMINHGITTGALFLMIGQIYERTHSRAIADHGGLATSMPVYGTFFLLATFASVGLPLTNGFIGEFLSLTGAFKYGTWFGILGATGVVLGAGYMLWMVERVFFGAEKNPSGHALHDLNVREILVMVPLLILMIYLGVRPAPLLTGMERSVDQLLTQMNIVK